MTINTDFAIDASKNIYYIGAVHGASGAGYYTVLELHRWASDLADDAAATGDDLVDITSLTPSDRSTDNIITLLNGYILDDLNGSATDPISQHLYDGSIIENAGLGSQNIWDGIVVIAAENMRLQVLQSGVTIVDDFWNEVPFGEAAGNFGLNRDVANGISHRFMINVNTSNADIDGRRLIGMTRVSFDEKQAGDVGGFTFSEFKINGTARGNNVMALTFAQDLNDTVTAAGAPHNTVANTNEGYIGIDVDANGADEFYYSAWNKNSASINQFYQRIKYLTRVDETTTLYGLPGQDFRGITHEITVTPGGALDYVEPEAISWTGTNAGTGQLLAIDNVDSGTATKIWMQLLTGVAPVSGDTIVGATNSATNVATGTVERTVSPVVAGVSTGSALIGAYGFGLTTSSLAATDKVFDLTNTQINPPNNVTFTVTGVIAGEDRVLVGPEAVGALNTTQFDISLALVGGDTTVRVDAGTGGNGETPGDGTQSASDTPNSGTIRVLGVDNVYHRLTYTSYTTDPDEMIFAGVPATGIGSMPTTAALNQPVFVSYIDKLANLYSTTSALTGAAVTSVPVTPSPDAAPIQPTTGTIRIEREDGTISEIAYTATPPNAFTIGSTDFSTTGVLDGAPVYVLGASNPTTASYTATYDGSNARDLFVRVRDGGTEGDATGIKTFETPASISDASTSVAAIRTSDA